MMFLEGNMNLNGLVALIVAIMVGPAIILAIIGFILKRNQNKKAANVFFILAAIYLVISFGICGGIM